MGISGFVGWLQTEFPEAFEEWSEETSAAQSYDDVYFDMNGFVHTSVRMGKTEEHVLIRLFQQIDRKLRFAQPTRRVVLALDGAGPVAKIKLQKSRRLASEKKGKKKGQHVSSSQITPGTGFMLMIEEALYHFA
eukprot:Ihof_evm1s1060 gene=Ihof_evmTU1s1060